MNLTRSWIVSSLFIFAACAHQGPAPEAAPVDTDTSPLITPAEVPWKDMTAKQKGRYMAKVVTPKMREVFQAYDAKEFAKFDCMTCHGKKAKANEFKMPTAELPVLPKSPDVFMATVMKEQPEMVKFMGEKVSPTVAGLLGVKPFDHKAPDENAFSCGNCHTLKDEPAKK